MRTRSSDRALPMRRRALFKSAAGLLGLALPPVGRIALAADEPPITAVRGKLAVLTGAGGNVLVRADDRGQIVVDTGAAAQAAELTERLSELPGGNRVGMVFNTHWHPDQIGSNAELGRGGATIVAHEKTRLRLSVGYYLPHEERYRAPLPPEAHPTETFRSRGETLVDGERIEYGYLLEAHTDGDIYVHFKDANVMAVGDAVSPVRDPELDWFGGGWIGGRVDALALLLHRSDDETLFVPSHGPVIRRADVRAEHDLMLELFERTVVRFRQGMSHEDMLAAGVMDAIPRVFEDPLKFLHDVHKSLWAHHNTLSHDIV